jgi:4-hydroxyproline epimerase
MGDVAWGGNWFFLSDNHGQQLEQANIEALVEFAWKVRRALRRHNITGAGGAEIDHIELFGPAVLPEAHGKNFVLCPGGAYDRSPCGTGTSARVACLVADGKLAPGDVWRQESIIGSYFDAWAEIEDGQIIPTIRGAAYVTAEATLLLKPDDPFREGIRR